MTVEIFTGKVSPWVIDFGSLPEPFDDEKLSRLGECNKHMRVERTVEGNVRMFPISDDQQVTPGK